MGPISAARAPSARRMTNAWQRVVLWLVALTTTVGLASFLLWSALFRRVSGEVGPPILETCALLGLWGIGILIGYGLAARLGRSSTTRRQHVPWTDPRNLTAQACGELSAALWGHPQLSASVDSLLEIISQVLRPHAIVLLRACGQDEFVIVETRPRNLLNASHLLQTNAHRWDLELVHQLQQTHQPLAWRQWQDKRRRPPYYRDVPALHDVVLAPIRHAHTLIGILAVDRQSHQLFRSNALHLVQHVAAQIGLALELQTALADQATAARTNAQLLIRMERMATTDGLTGLNNHRQFHHVFDNQLACAERYGRKLSLILADIDHFKQINDVHGHLGGDRVLRRIAAIIQSCARKTDVVARYGGEEFAVLMEETDAQGARQISERIRRAIESELFIGDAQTFHATLSLGVSTFPEHGLQKELLIQRADQALYQAKHQGRNQTIVFDATSSEVTG